MQFKKVIFLLFISIGILSGCATNSALHRDMCIVGTIGAGTAIGGVVGNGPGLVLGGAGGALVSHFICGEDSPIMQEVADSDGDGVNDNNDACPGTPRGVPVDSRGCPRDDDNDGVANNMDACPGTPRGVPVDSRGCPRDDDNDGVANHVDECPGTPRGVRVDAKGCPEVGETLLTINNINFAFDSSELDASSRAVLDEAARVIKQQRGVRLNIVGHTDSTGPENYNQSLSERRADAVRLYLIANGIDSSRLTSSGKGESEPVASNDTRQGRATNRRVEFVVVQ